MAAETCLAISQSACVDILKSGSGCEVHGNVLPVVNVSALLLLLGSSKVLSNRRGWNCIVGKIRC